MFKKFVIFVVVVLILILGVVMVVGGVGYVYDVDFFYEGFFGIFDEN